jgi:hypothetical protein
MGWKIHISLEKLAIEKAMPLKGLLHNRQIFRSKLEPFSWENYSTKYL